MAATMVVAAIVRLRGAAAAGRVFIHGKGGESGKQLFDRTKIISAAFKNSRKLESFARIMEKRTQNSTIDTLTVIFRLKDDWDNICNHCTTTKDTLNFGKVPAFE